MYGIALDQVFANYERPSESFHAALSAGVGVNNYDTRWHFGRPRLDTSFTISNTPPNTSIYSLALPIQFQAIYEPFRYVGVGALLFYTISTLQPSYGGAVVVEVRY